MIYCDRCDNNIDGLPFHCRRCSQDFCSKHRLPENHHCPGLKSSTELSEDWRKSRIGARRTLRHRRNPIYYRAPQRLPHIPTWVIGAIILMLIGAYVYQDNPDALQGMVEDIEGSIPKMSSIELPKSPAQPEINIDELEMEIHNKINEQRKSYGLSSLNWDPFLRDIARKHSEDMDAQGYFDHYSLDGCDPTCRGDKVGYNCHKELGGGWYSEGIAENIFQNNLYDSITYINGIPFHNWNTMDEIAESTVSGWMASPGHRQNILEPDYDRGSIGVAISNSDEVLVTQDFC